MKIQCSCGAKYEFEITPEVARNGVQFVCPACGLDSSEYVNELVRQQRDQASGQAPPPAPAPAPSLRVRVNVPAPAAAPAQEEVAGQCGPQRCSKHPGEVVVEKCFVCSKPICPKCMELFGYVCSPLCKARAESHGIEVPVFEGQRTVVEARLWRKVAIVSTAIGVVVALLVGFWFWYAWFGSEPTTVFSVRFPERSYSGQSAVGGQDQLVFLHGGTLARYDLKTKKEIWSQYLIDTNQIAAEATKEIQQEQAWAIKAQQEGSEGNFRPPPLEKLIRMMERSAAAELELRVSGSNLWVTQPGKLQRYDWESGKLAKEIRVPRDLAALVPRAEEFLLVEAGSGRVTHVNFTTCEARAEDLLGRPVPALLAGGTGTNSAPKSGGPAGRGAPGGSQQLAGLPTGMPGKDLGKPMDPARVAEEAQHLSYPARIALPATLSATLSQERALTELNDTGRPPPTTTPTPQLPSGEISLIPTTNGFVQLFVKLLEQRFEAHTAMKAAPKKSVLDGPVSMATSMDAANEVLNEMQRSRGGDVVEEDVSRYQVTVRRPEISTMWTGEVVGPPTLLPLDTVDVLTANKRIIVFDKKNNKLWESTLAFNVSGGAAAFDPQNAPYGLGPCAEWGGALYVFDQGVLTAFDLATGRPQWRLPSVGIVGMFFDSQGMIYVNSTTASPDSIRYSRQIDISQQTSALVLKVDAKSGKVMWQAQLGGLVNYVSGKFLYTVASYAPYEDEDDLSPTTGFETPPYVRIKRINPRNGRVMWEHFQQRAPLDVQFDRNSIRLVFRKEVQVLRYLSL
ncbi:putative Pyrrolo-quinoline quinone [Verrucomicrobia bacterium]|nr:putative Pyrrolo-quinoline quinone [Verrucomicrobiota bacterium]